MTTRSLMTRLTITLSILIILGGCAPKITFYVTRPPKLPIHGIDAISVGSVQDDLGAKIALPGKFTRNNLKGSRSLSPRIDQFQANHRTAGLVRSMLLSGLSSSGQYQIIQQGSSVNGIIPDPKTVAIVTAKVRFFEATKQDSENMFYLLIATKGNLELRDQLALMGIKGSVVAEAERAKKGFKVDTSYVETISAMEIEFDLVRQSDGKKLIKTQVYRSYYTEKWGGDPNTSHLPEAAKRYVVTTFRPQTTLFDDLGEEFSQLDLARTNPEEFLAKGGKLSSNKSVPTNRLDAQTRLTKEIVSEFLKQISQYTVETTLPIADGDPIAVNFLEGNAYELAINRLENITRSEQDSFNLALAYESIGEYPQAARYYQEALDKNPGNRTYLDSLKRVSR